MKKTLVLFSLILSFGFAQKANATCMGKESGAAVNYYTHHYTTTSTESSSSGCCDLATDSWGCSAEKADKEAYWGWRNGIKETQVTNGRAQAVWAQLDACFSGGSNHSEQITDSSSCYSMCDATTFTNQSCQSESSALGSCWTRCDAVNWSSPR